ncbi:MAG: regulator [Nitrospirota bacterium]|nr:regulator [Nitrospirota bacterium]
MTGGDISGRATRLMVTFALLAALVSCSSNSGPAQQAAPPKPAPTPVVHAVAEQFEVGPTAYVRSLHVEDRQLYVGTSTGVLVVDRTNGNMERTFTRDDGMRNNYAFIVRPDAQGTLWMGTNGGGLSLWRDGQMKNYLPKHGLADLWVYDVLFSGGTTWLATWDGVNRITGTPDDKSSWTTYNTEDGLANPWVYAIQQGRDGALWFGTEGGLSRLKDGQWTTWRHPDGLGAPNPGALARSPKSGFGSVRPGEESSHSHDLTTLDDAGGETYNANYVFSLHMDPQQTLWIGTWGGGVSRYDGKQFSHLTQADGLAGNVVYAIAQGPDGAYWFGTNHGLTRYDGNRWDIYNRERGLLGEDVYTVVVDADNVVWAGQKGGVSKLVPLAHSPA